MLILLLLCPIERELKAAHILGSQMTYECIDPDVTDDLVRFQIKCTIFVDKFGAISEDQSYDFGIYEEVETNSWSWISTKYDQNTKNKFMLQIDSSNPCLPLNIGVEGFSYIFDIDLPLSDNSYMIAHQQCCRSPLINNIIESGDTGMAISIEISPEAQRTCDTSPQFNELPPVFVCQGQPLEVDFSAIDLEGDELQYSFCAPKTSYCYDVLPDPEVCPPPYDDIYFLDPIGTPGGLTWQTPIAGDPVIAIDPITGLITGAPTQVGQYVTGVCVQAFRDNQLIAEVIRDFTFTVGEISLSTKESKQNFTSLYPNPTNGLFEIEFPSILSGRLSISNVIGEIVIEKDIQNTDQLQIDLTEEDTGVYVVQFVSSDNIARYIERVVVY